MRTKSPAPAGALPANIDEMVAWEIQQRELLRSHPALQNVLAASDETLFSMLQQRRFVSFLFTTVYDLAIDGLTKPQHVIQARKILRDEYPDLTGHKPSHRELLMLDLISLGLTRAKVNASAPTPATWKYVKAMVEFIQLKPGESEESHETKLIAMLRFWGEVIVADEYEALAPRLKLNGVLWEDLKFYFQHWQHDRVILELNNLTIAAHAHSHSDALGRFLAQRLLPGGAPDASALAICAETEASIVRLRNRFWSQFSPAVQLA